MGEAEFLVQPDRVDVAGDRVQKGTSPRAAMPAATERVSLVAKPWPRHPGSVQTALISVQPGGRNRSPAIATSSPSRLMPR